MARGFAPGECGWLRMEAGVCRGGLFWFRSWRFERNGSIAGLLARQLRRAGFAVPFLLANGCTDSWRTKIPRAKMRLYIFVRAS